MFEGGTRQSSLGFDIASMTPAEFLAECERIEAEPPSPEEAIRQLVDDFIDFEDSRDYLRDIIFNKIDTRIDTTVRMVTPEQILEMGRTETRYELDFSSDRVKPQDLFKKYFDGTYGDRNGKKTKKSTVAAFGHLETSAAQNFSKVFSLRDNDRRVTFEFMAICCLYFQVEPYYAITLFHKCINLDELMGYKVLGGALWLFLKHELYDYELYVRKCCEALKLNHSLLPDYISGSRYWNEVYDSI